MWLRKWKFWAPEVEVLEVAVEKGFAGSMEGFGENDPIEG